MIETITLAAKAFALPPALLIALCTVESNLNNTINIHDGGSPSYGICQVKLQTARMFNNTVHVGNLLNPYLNALYAAAYLKWQATRYAGNLCYATAAYNAGKVKWKRGRIKNAKYVLKVQKRYGNWRNRIAPNQRHRQQRAERNCWQSAGSPSMVRSIKKVSKIQGFRS